MKNTVVRLLAALMMVCLTACSSTPRPTQESRQGSLVPYELTERESVLLEVLGVKDRAQIIEFHAPEGVKSVAVEVHRLSQDGAWDTETALAFGYDTETSEAIVDGRISMLLSENHVIEFQVSHNGGGMNAKTEEIVLDTKTSASTTGFLESAADIVLDQEIPVAFLVYDSDGHMPGASVESYFEPSNFQGMDLVQAVTLTFSDEPL